MFGLVLASGSPRRTELMKQIGLKFDIIPADVDEAVCSEMKPEELVLELSGRKAGCVAQKLGTGMLVIGADTVVVKDGILGKPRDKAEAYDMLSSLSSGWHEVVTGITLVETGSGKIVKGTENTRVKLRKLSKDIIRTYIDTGEPMDKAGAYGIQGLGALLVERLEGCYFNVVGLPLSRLAMMLGEFGYRVL